MCVCKFSFFRVNSKAKFPPTFGLRLKLFFLFRQFFWSMFTRQTHKIFWNSFFTLFSMKCAYWMVSSACESTRMSLCVTFDLSESCNHNTDECHQIFVHFLNSDAAITDISEVPLVLFQLFFLPNNFQSWCVSLLSPLTSTNPTKLFRHANLVKGQTLTLKQYQG